MPDKNPPELPAEAGWRDLEKLPLDIGSGRTILQDEKRLVLRLFRNEKSEIVGKVWFGDGLNGPPECVHGGVTCYVLDEILGAAGVDDNLTAPRADAG